MSTSARMKINLETDSNRVFGLDIFRSIAIILVVLGHGGFILNGSRLEGFPYIRMIDGVDIFFVLSGFLIGGILLEELNKKENFGITDLLRFWKRRWFRTLPNYYLILSVNYIVVKYSIINESIEQFNYHFLTFTHNFHTPFYGFFWESWSLSVEEWFYVIAPILIFWLCRFFSVKTSFLVVSLAMISFSLFYRSSIYDSNMDHFWWDVTFRKVVLTRLDSIGYGLFSAWIYFYYVKFWEAIKIPAFVTGVVLIFFILNYDQGPNSMYKQILYFSVVPFSVMLLLPLTEGYKSAKGIIPMVLQHISKISYSMYLINLALVAEVIRDNFPPTGGIDSLIKYVLYWVIVVAVSSFLFKYFEKPVTNLRDKNIPIPFLTKSKPDH